MNGVNGGLYERYFTFVSEVILSHSKKKININDKTVIIFFKL